MFSSSAARCGDVVSEALAVSDELTDGSVALERSSFGRWKLEQPTPPPWLD